MDMQYRHLGRSGLRVSRLSLGTFNFGLATGEQEARRIMDAALEAGINLFDTANHYPDFVHCGLSEQAIGRWFADQPGRRARTPRRVVSGAWRRRSGGLRLVAGPPRRADYAEMLAAVMAKWLHCCSMLPPLIFRSCGDWWRTP